MSYTVSIKNKARKALEKIHPVGIRQAIEQKIHNLVNDPKAQGIKMEGLDDHYRFRQGDYRVIYNVDDDEVKVVVVKVGTRGDVYKD